MLPCPFRRALRTLRVRLRREQSIESGQQLCGQQREGHRPGADLVQAAGRKGDREGQPVQRDVQLQGHHQVRQPGRPLRRAHRSQRPTAGQGEQQLCYSGDHHRITAFFFLSNVPIDFERAF